MSKKIQKYRKYHVLYESHERFSVGEFYLIFGVPKPSHDACTKWKMHKNNLVEGHKVLRALSGLHHHHAVIPSCGPIASPLPSNALAGKSCFALSKQLDMVCSDEADVTHTQRGRAPEG